MTMRLLLAIDHHESGRAAVDEVIRLAAPSASDVSVLHVREVPSSLGIAPLESAVEAQGLVDAAVDRLRAAGIAADGDVVSAHVSCVAQLIVDEASQRGCHAIVLGSLRRRGLPSALVHRMRARSIRLSPLPVVITPPARSAVASPVGA